MKHNSLFAIAFAALISSAAIAQTSEASARKWDARTAAIITSYQNSRATRATATDSMATVRFVISTSNAEAAADSIRLLGGTATVIDETTLTAQVPVCRILKVANLRSVRRLNCSRRFHLKNNTSRQLSNVDSVHSGFGLETPFTGKGVVVGFIDAGFQYRHPAFLDSSGNPRVIALWNHLDDDATPTTTIPTNYDGDTESGGHATHVTGIAAGTRYDGNAYYGMAPEADIIMVPSQLYEDNILAEAKWIKNTAEKQGKPWVINMSFGSQVGPHDGSTDYDQAMSALCGAGGLMTGAMGNEGEDNLHLSATVADGEETTILVSNNTDDDYVIVDFWGNATDGKEHFEITPFVYNSSTKKTITLSDTKWMRVGEFGNEISSYNNKQNYYAYVSLSTMASTAGISSSSNAYFGLRVKAIDGTASFHAWCESGYGTFIKKGTVGQTGDNNYLVGQAAASIPRALGVASYNGAKSWVAATDGNTYSYTGYSTTGQISSFSSPGPSLGTDVKPTVAAPGATITSSINRYVGLTSTTFSKSDATIVCAVDRTTGKPVSYSTASTKNNDFYGVMAGTSMATPAVAGIVALWLQANPTLTPEDVVKIIRTTSTRDSYTGGTSKEWTATAGYGKINAYAGLKAALQMGNTNGIVPTMGNDKPVTLSMSASEWRILFNTVESTASIRVTRLDGTLAYAKSLSNMRPGNEVVLPLSNLTAGVYVISITTPQAITTRKILVGR